MTIAERAEIYGRNVAGQQEQCLRELHMRSLGRLPLAFAVLAQTAEAMRAADSMIREAAARVGDVARDAYIAGANAK